MGLGVEHVRLLHVKHWGGKALRLVVALVHVHIDLVMTHPSDGPSVDEAAGHEILGVDSSPNFEVAVGHQIVVLVVLKHAIVLLLVHTLDIALAVHLVHATHHIGVSF